MDINLNAITVPSLFAIEDLQRLSRSDAEAQIRARCTSHYLGNNQILCLCLGRYKAFIDTRDTAITPHILMDGFWEMWITQFIARTVKPGMTVADIGANFGYYSLLMAELVGQDGHCLTVEANPNMIDQLTRTLSINGFAGRSTICATALHTEASGRFPFRINRRDNGGSHITYQGAVSDTETDVIEVPSTNLDTLAINLPPLDFIKIDAEGSGFAILKGMSQTLKRSKPRMLVEFSTNNADDNADFLDALSAIYGDIGYVDDASNVRPITSDELLTTRRGDVWMLYVD